MSTDMTAREAMSAPLETSEDVFARIGDLVLSPELSPQKQSFDNEIYLTNEEQVKILRASILSDQAAAYTETEFRENQLKFIAKTHARALLRIIENNQNISEDNVCAMSSVMGRLATRSFDALGMHEDEIERLRIYFAY